jgi:hypothetical protein
MTCCALGDRDDQDAILGHVASRGDRFPVTRIKTLSSGMSTIYAKRTFADHEQFRRGDAAMIVSAAHR